MNKLPYRPLPAPGEGLYGFLLRLAEGNGYGSVDFLLGEEKISLVRLVQWLGLSTTQPLKQFFLQLQSTRMAHIQPWNLQNSRYCPQCLEDYPSWRIGWECKYFTVCPKHGTRLIEVCTNCGQRLTWKRSTLLTCDCGAQLAKATADKADEAEIRLASALLSKIEENQPHAISLTRFLNLSQLCQTIHVFGSYAHADEMKMTQKTPYLANIEIATKLAKAAAEIIVNWPGSFYRLLNNLRSLNSPQSQAALLTKEYGFLYSYVFSRMTSRKFDFICTAFENHIANNWLVPLTRRNKRISPDGLSSGVWLPLNQAAKQLGTTRLHLESMYDAGIINLNTRRLESNKRMLCIDRAFLPGIKELLEDMVDHKTACSILSIKKTRMTQLLKCHVVHAYTEHRAAGGIWGISLKSLREILSIGESLSPSESIPTTTVDMAHALRFWLLQDFLFPTLIQAVKNLEIMPVSISPGQPGIPGWIFDHDRLKAWCNEQIQKARNGALTIPQVAVGLGIKQEAVYHFVRKGILKADEMDASAKVKLVTQQELLRFRASYVLSRELAESIGTSPSHVVKMLEQRGVKPVCGKSVDGCVQYLYQRTL